MIANVGSENRAINKVDPAGSKRRDWLQETGFHDGGMESRASKSRSNGLNDKAEKGNASLIFITTTRERRDIADATTKRSRGIHIYAHIYARVAVLLLGTAINAPFVGWQYATELCAMLSQIYACARAHESDKPAKLTVRSKPRLFVAKASLRHYAFRHPADGGCYRIDW